jgi:hypothetical protein
MTSRSKIGGALQSRGWVLIVAALMTSTNLEAQMVALVTADIRVHIELDRGTYRKGDPVRVRLTLQNMTSDSITFLEDTPRGYVDLRLVEAERGSLKANEKLVRQAIGLDGPRGAGKAYLKGGERRTLTWKGSEWIDLQDWGLKLDTPGQYRLVGRPRLVDFWNPPSKSKTTLNQRKPGAASNEVVFTLAQ